MAKPGLSARIAAINLVEGVLSDKRPLSEMTTPDGSILRKLSGSERARAQSLAITMLKHIEPLDMLLDFYLQKNPPLRARLILAMCATELLIDGISPHAAIDSAVNISKMSQYTRHMSGMINAIGRKLNTDGREHWPEHPDQQMPYYLRTPLEKDYGADYVEKMEAAHAMDVPLDITLRDPAELDHFAKEFDATVIGNATLRLWQAGQVSRLPGFEEGRWWVQDYSASLPARCLGDLSGKDVLDLCAAPGGKTLQLSANGGNVVALDMSRPRLARLYENLDRTGLKAKVVVANALNWQPDGPVDAILLDAPCSATGTIRRHPDLPFLKDAKAINDLAALQYDLLERAFEWLKPGGEMIYSTCSLLKKEGESQIQRFLQKTEDAAVVPIDAEALNIPNGWVAKQGWIRLLPSFMPDEGGLDGFFIAKITKKTK